MYIIVALIKLCGFVGLNCSNYTYYIYIYIYIMYPCDSVYIYMIQKCDNAVLIGI
jgi:hypothetical protein